ncbi:unnamed protein product [Ixodes pacificus]
MRTRDEDLPAELQRIAYEELGETDQGRADALARLNQLLDEDPELNARRDNVFLLRYIRVRKYNIEATLATLKFYYKNRAAYPSIYDNFLPSNAKPASRRIFMVLPNPDVHGRRVMLIRSGEKRLNHLYWLALPHACTSALYGQRWEKQLLFTGSRKK